MLPSPILDEYCKVAGPVQLMNYPVLELLNNVCISNAAKMDLYELSSACLHGWGEG